MSLSCACEYDPEPGDVIWWAPNYYSTLNTKRARKCVSCGEHIAPAAIVAAFARMKVPEYEIEIAIYGEDYDQGPPRATWYLCETCADLFFSLTDLGFCIDITENMRELVKEYASVYGNQHREAI